jgi:uncharacterized protein
VQELVQFLARALVEEPDAVRVERIDEDDQVVLEVSVADPDVGRVIGRGGRVANALRSVAKAAAARSGERVTVEILD